MSAASDKAEADRLEKAQFDAFMRSTFAPTSPVAPAEHPRSPVPVPAGPVDLHQGPRDAAAPDEDAAFAAYMAQNFGVG